MSDPENFLTRWSRRKLEPAEKDVPSEQPPAANAPASEGAAKPAPLGDAAPEFDISTLPSLDSIGANSDIRAFLQAGVPSALRHAALRRAWSADPAIRDFVGLNENFWDAAGVEHAPGFGTLDPNLDVKKLVSEIFGESEQKSESPVEQSARDESAPEQPQQIAARNTEPLLQRDENIALQRGDPQQDAAPAKPRRHGRAMPQ